MKTITRIVDRITQGLLVLLMAVMVLDVSWQVVTRFVLRRPSSFTEELATFLLIWIGLLGGAWAYRRKAHLAIDLLARKMSGRGRLGLDLTGHLCVITFAMLVLVAGGMHLVLLTFELEQRSASIGLPIGWVYSVLPLSGVLIMWYGIVFLVEDWSRGTRG